MCMCVCVSVCACAFEREEEGWEQHLAVHCPFSGDYLC